MAKKWPNKNEESQDFKDDSPHFIGAHKIASILGDTIVWQKPPLTVGVFGKWNSGKSQLLSQTRERMESISALKKPNHFSAGLFSLFYRLLFFNPILNSTRQRSAHYIFVHFSILDYAGSDEMWAGVITHISNKIDEVFGKWSVKLFRTFHYKAEVHLDPYLKEDCRVLKTNKRWKFVPLKSLFCIFLVLGLIGGSIALWVVYGVPSVSSEEETSSSDVFTIVSTSIVGFATLLKIGDIVKVISNLAKSQVQKIIALTKQTDFSKSLGFMGKVKNEIYYITAVVLYMGVLLDKELRICLMIDDVDLLQRTQIMNLFQVVSLLQSSPNSAYVQILCMDPMIAANLIKKALTKELSSNISGHAYLKKHIQLPFYIPPVDYRQNKSFRESRELAHVDGGGFTAFLFISAYWYIMAGDDIQVKTRTRKRENQRDKGGVSNPKSSSFSIEMEPLHEENKEIEYNRYQLVKKMREEFLFDYKLAPFIDGNQRALKRVLISSQLAAGIMAEKRNKIPNEDEMKKLLAWTTLVDQWPYRLSWIRQVIEDNIQMHRLENHLVRLISCEALLEDVYHVVEAKLCQPLDWKNLLDLDNDPEIFMKFLQRFPFTVEDLKCFLPFTTNLDTSLRRIIALFSAKHQIETKASHDIESNQARWLQSVSLENWSVEDVCFELENMKLNQNNLNAYLESVRKHEITGNILIDAEKKTLQVYFNMTPGDWNVFWITIRTLRIFKEKVEPKE